MFDVSFTELLVIGIVALVVIGPEKLPRVARTVGHLMGRAQRYVNDVKRDIRQELDAADQASGGLMTLKEDVQQAARELEHSITEATQDARAAAQTLHQPLQAVEQEVAQAMQPLGQDLNPAAITPADEPSAADVAQASVTVTAPAPVSAPAPGTAVSAATTKTITPKNAPPEGQP